MKLVLNNITHHSCPVGVRERVSFTHEQRRFFLKKMHAKRAVSEAAILETCNRIEFYLYAKKNFDVSTFLTALIGDVRPEAVDTWLKYHRQTTGMDVVRHLFEVAAGLDSQMIGENQILSQVKSAYTDSIGCRMSKFMFHRLFHIAFRVGKAVRSSTGINCGAVSVSLAAVELARGKIQIPHCSAMVIGAGENAELAARYVLKAGLKHLIVANRNRQKALVCTERLAAGEVIGLDQIPEKLNEVDLLIGSTASTEPVVTYQMVENVLAHRDRPLLIIDIAVPRDIDPQIGRFGCVSLYNIDDLNEQISKNKEKRSSEIPKARRIVAEFTDKFVKWYDSLNLLPVVSQLTQKGIDLARTEAARYAKDFGSGNSEKLQLFAESLTRKLLHGPISLLKGLGDEEPDAEQLQVLDLINKMFLSQGKFDQ